MISKELWNAIIEEINLQAEWSSERRQRFSDELDMPNSAIYEHGKEVGLRSAISIMRKHYLKSGGEIELK